MPEKIDIRKAVREAEHGITGKRYCTSCQSMQPALTGKMIEGTRNRWQCCNCNNRVSARKYLLKKGEGDA